MNINSSIFLKIAGASGALAIGLGAYGAHSKTINADEHTSKIFATASRYHLIHSVALLGVPSCPRPMITGSLMCAGMLLFCGGLYTQALSGSDKIRFKIAPVGGTILIFAWLSIVF